MNKFLKNFLIFFCCFICVVPSFSFISVSAARTMGDCQELALNSWNDAMQNSNPNNCNFFIRWGAPLVSSSGYGIFTLSFSSVPTLHYDDDLHLYYYDTGSSPYSVFTTSYYLIGGSADGNPYFPNIYRYLYLKGQNVLHPTGYTFSNSLFSSQPDFGYFSFDASVNPVMNFTPNFSDNVPSSAKDAFLLNSDYEDFHALQNAIDISFTPYPSDNMSSFTTFNVTIKSYPSVYVMLQIIDRNINDDFAVDSGITDYYSYYYGADASIVGYQRQASAIYTHSELGSMNNDVNYTYSQLLYMPAYTTKTFNINLSNIPNLQANHSYTFVIWVNLAENVQASSNSVPTMFYFRNGKKPFSLNFSPYGNGSYISKPNTGFGVTIENNVYRDSNGNITGDSAGNGFNNLSLSNMKNILSVALSILSFFTICFGTLPINLWIIISTGLTTVVVIGVVKAII